MSDQRGKWAAVVLSAATALAGSSAWAQDPPTGSSSTPLSVQGSVDQFYGSFQESVPILIPAFHSITPELGLSYNSTSPNGHFGLGWNLSQPSIIERATS